ncbi:MAG: hypothetical protein A3H44_09145 [Gammaproteobacteria bacterium RIFCSPLOWO2_02_FULL_57_10]|nr:MAG: hypothetical protein A3H44_09145 [Gammaproteobacteria bacterium RIFCSPLOWO2_02_FULL_57_10]
MDTADQQSAKHEGRLQNTVLLMVLLNGFTTPLMLSATNVALPAMADDLQLSAVALSWIPMAYLVASAMFVLPFGGLADRIGRKRVFLQGTVAVILTSILAAVSFNATMLISARFLQGVASAMLYATQIAILSSVFPAQKRGQMVGLLVSSIYVGLAAGPFIGGFVIDTLGWRYGFLLQLPLALVVLLVGVFKVDGEWSANSQAPFDTVGAITFCTSLLLICVAATRLPLLDGFVMLVTGTILAVTFVRHALKIPEPIWDVRLFFTNRLFTLSCLASLVMYSATYANVVLLSLFLQYLKALSATQTGMILMLQPLTMAVLSPLAGRLSDRIEPRLLATSGVAMTTIGLALLATLDSTSRISSVVMSLLISGAGFALFSSPNINSIMGSVEARQMGSASGAVATMRTLGQLISMLLVSLMLNLFMGSAVISEENYPVLERTVSVAFGLAAALCLVGMAMSLARGTLHSGKKGASA